MALQTSLQTKSAALNAQLALLDGGKLRIYSGEQPPTTDSSVGVAVLLSEHDLDETAFEQTATSTATANPIEESTALASGTASFYRSFSESGVCHRQGSAGVSGSGAELILDNASIIKDGTVTVVSYSVNQG